jgi:hypothetical protein
MKFWIREFAGWLLVALGLFVFYRCYLLLTATQYYVQGGLLTLIGVILFRGGIHLLKIAIAARICVETEESLQSPARQRTGSSGLREMARPAGARR